MFTNGQQNNKRKVLFGSCIITDQFTHSPTSATTMIMVRSYLQILTFNVTNKVVKLSHTSHQSLVTQVWSLGGLPHLCESVSNWFVRANCRRDASLVSASDDIYYDWDSGKHKREGGECGFSYLNTQSSSINLLLA